MITVRASRNSIPPKLNARSDPNDPLDKAGHLIWTWLARPPVSPGKLPANRRSGRNLSAQLPVLKTEYELEGQIRQHAERADRAERWLHLVSVEIEPKFFARENGRPSQPPASTGPFTKPGAIRPSKLASGIPLKRCESGKMPDKKLVQRHHFKSASLEDRDRRLPILMATVATRWRYRKR